MDWEPGCRCGPCVRKREAYVQPNRLGRGVKVRFPKTEEPFRIYTLTAFEPMGGGAWILTPKDARAEEQIKVLSEATLQNPAITTVVS